MKIQFPCEGVPEVPAAARLVGLYPQRQAGLWMQRVKVLGGALTAVQWRLLGRIARELTPTAPLHLTTRQDVELHDIPSDRVGPVQRRLADGGLTGLGACGDTLRNLTVCPCAGALDGTVDLIPLAWAVRRTLEAIEGIFSLPRKLKISLSCGDACGQPWINDLGLVARPAGAQWVFSVTAGGSLGVRPGLAIRLLDSLPADDVPTLAAAAASVFAAEGDRENRHRARLRHVRERIGDEPFRERLLGALEDAKKSRTWPAVELRPVADGHAARALLTFPNGDISPGAAEALADLAERQTIVVRIGNHHRVALFGETEEALRQAAGGQEALAPAAVPQPTVVACPGSRWCSRALVDTNALADRIRRELGGSIPPTATVCISGCPNGCAHSRVADVGLTGALTKRDGAKAEAFDLFAGGGMGRDDRLAEPIARRLVPDEAIDRIREQLDARSA